MKIGVMQGHLREFDLAQVLEVVGISRQYMGVEVRRGAGLMGTIFTKSGQVVSVDVPDAEGREALSKLFQLHDGYFYVFRMETPDALPAPLGGVHGLLMEVIARRSSPNSGLLQAHEAGSAPAPAPSPEGVSGASDIGSAPPAAPVRASSLSPEPPRVGSSARPPTLPPPRRESFIPRPDPTPGGPGKVVAIASPKGGCGKTTVALNLALSLARQGRSVVLVDGDINGDVLSAIDARQRAELGLFDLLRAGTSPREALLETILPRFRILPAVGATLPEAESFTSDQSDDLRRVFDQLAQDTDIVVVDTPAGMFGITHQILAASSHVIGVLQAEVVANRSFSRFQDGIRMVPEANRPGVLGIVINMLQMRHSASLSVFQNACSELPTEWLFDTSIPRHRAFLDATQQGVPVRHMDEQAPPAVAFLFDNLAAEVVERLQLGSVERRPRRLLI